MKQCLIDEERGMLGNIFGVGSSGLGIIKKGG